MRTENHEEVYRIVEKKGDRYYFTVSSKPDVKGYLRDGRYFGMLRAFWRWENLLKNGPAPKKGWQCLAKYEEIIEWPWTEKFKKDIEDFPKGLMEYPQDWRDTIDFEANVNKAQLFGRSGAGDNIRVDFKWPVNGVMVPAGTFDNCYKTIVSYHVGGTLSYDWWQNHAIWAPGVGMIKEFQKRSNGEIAYEMDLIQFTKSAVKEGVK